MASSAGTRSFELANRLFAWCGAWGCALGLAACEPMALAPVAGEVPACESLGDVTSANRQAAGDLQRSVESSALFGAAAAGTGVQGCSVWHAGRSVELLYRFRSGGQFTAKRDPAIELTEQRAKLALPSMDDPLGVLGRAERQAFGEQGCGIDWAHPDTEAAKSEPGATDTVWHGDTCNCRARVRRDALGTVIELALTSAC